MRYVQSVKVWRADAATMTGVYILGCMVTRFLFLANSYNFRAPAAYVFPVKGLDEALVNLGQIFLFLAYFTMIFVWREIVRASQSMKSIKVDEQDKRLFRAVLIGSMTMSALFLPMDITAAYAGMTILSTFTSGVKSLMCVSLVAYGGYFSCKLYFLVSKGAGSQTSRKNVQASTSRIDALHNVLRTAIYSTLLCFLVVGSVVGNMIMKRFFATHPVIKLFGYWLIVHASVSVPSIGVMRLYSIHFTY
jgi:hypothetical protein